MRRVLPFAVLALPLAAAIWVVGDFAADKEAERADARLTGSLRAAVEQYDTAAAGLERRAATVASSPRVQRAFAEHDLRTLRRLGRARGVTLVPGGTLRRPDAPALTRIARVRAGDDVLGSVLVSLPLDGEFARRLHAGAHLPPDVRLVFVRRDGRVAAPGAAAGRIPANRAEPANGRLGGRDYRTVSSLTGEPRLVALLPQSAIAAEQRRARLTVLLAGLVTLFSVVVIAYLLAPAFARARVGKSQREQAARVLEHVADGICVVDEVGRVTYWNPAAALITGVRAAVVHGRHADDAVKGWAKVRELVPVTESLATSTDAPREVTVPLDADGRELWLSVSAVHYSDGTVYAFRDLTEEHRLEEMRTDLVATVSHELRTPLASIHGAAITLRRRDGTLDASTRDELLAIVAEQSNRLARLADEILLASQLGRGRTPLRDEAVDLSELAREAVDAAHVRVGGRISVVLRVRAPLPAAAGDGDKVRQVLANLVDNAIKYSPDGGRIEVGVEGVDDRLRLSVRDQGIGIPPRDLERVFEKFFRLDPQLSRGIGGSGLGLYISRELLRHMGGRIWAESEPGRGSVFYVELPAAKRQVRAA